MVSPQKKHIAIPFSFLQNTWPLAPENRPGPKKKRSSLEELRFSGDYVSFRESHCPFSKNGMSNKKRLKSNCSASNEHVAQLVFHSHRLVRGYLFSFPNLNYSLKNHGSLLLNQSKPSFLVISKIGHWLPEVKTRPT